MQMNTAIERVGRWSLVVAALCGGWLAAHGEGAAASADGAVPVVRIDAEARLGVRMTVYEDDLTLVSETRQAELGQGRVRLIWHGISPKARPDSAVLHSRDGTADFGVLEQHFDLQPLTPQALARHFVGRPVRVVRTHPTTGAETEVDAVLLSVEQGVVLRIGDRIETSVPGRIVYGEIPQGLGDYPALEALCEHGTDGSVALELDYLSAGIQWQANYVAELNAGEDRLDLVGRARVSNRSGADYGDVNLRLVAGEVHRVSGRVPRPEGRVFRAMAADERQGVVGLHEERVSDYHMYRVPRPVSLDDGQTRQLGLLAAREVPVTKAYRVTGPEYLYRSLQSGAGRRVPVALRLEFRNDRESGLGVPLPAGTVRVYLKDAEGEAVFLGEDRTAPVSSGEVVRLNLGNAFDVTARRRQTEYRKLGAVGKYRNAFSIGYEIVLRNARSNGVVVDVVELIPGDWEITRENHSHERRAAYEVRWRIPVPAEGRTTLSYTTTVRY